MKVFISFLITGIQGQPSEIERDLLAHTTCSGPHWPTVFRFVSVVIRASDPVPAVLERSAVSYL